jgi:hypothetical protein
MKCIDTKFEIFAKVGGFPITDVVGAGHDAIIGFADAVISAIFTAVEVGIAVWAHSAKPDPPILDIQV